MQIQIKNIIFDLGGVLLNINYLDTQRAFIDLGIKKFDKIYSQLKQNNLFDDFETGKCTEKQFCEALIKISGKDLSHLQIKNAWNAMLYNLPLHRIELLTNLKKKYHLFLLSNTNEIHEEAFKKIIIDEYKSYILDDIFEAIYLSHRIKKRKPNSNAFLHVLTENNLMANETLFIDDSEQHITGAQKCGIHAIHLEAEKDVCSLFDNQYLML